MFKNRWNRIWGCFGGSSGVQHMITVVCFPEMCCYIFRSDSLSLLLSFFIWCTRGLSPQMSKMNFRIMLDVWWMKSIWVKCLSFVKVHVFFRRNGCTRKFVKGLETMISLHQAYIYAIHEIHPYMDSTQSIRNQNQKLGLCELFWYWSELGKWQTFLSVFWELLST